MINFENIVKKVLNESLSQMAYHFTTLKKYYQIVDSNKITFSKAYGTDVDVNNKYGKKSPYYFSTTRIRDGRVGFSKGKNVRIELNTDFFNNRFRANAVNFYGSRNKYKTILGLDDGSMSGNKYETESEDRIYSDVPEITGVSKCINRVDVLIPLQIDELKEMVTRNRDYYTMLRDIFNSDMGLKTFIYNDEMQFNLQGKNITEEVLKWL